MTPAAKVLIDKLPATASDNEIARLVALYMLEMERIPYWFSIDHDIRPPAMRACPVRFDWAKKDRVGIKTNIRPMAEAWIIEAALHGYTVQRDNGTPLTMSIKRAREIAKWAQTPDDDDIPF
jgi:hypothetical protein